MPLQSCTGGSGSSNEAKNAIQCIKKSVGKLPHLLSSKRRGSADVLRSASRREAIWLHLIEWRTKSDEFTRDSSGERRFPSDGLVQWLHAIRRRVRAPIGAFPLSIQRVAPTRRGDDERARAGSADRSSRGWDRCAGRRSWKTAKTSKLELPRPLGAPAGRRRGRHRRDG